MTIEIRDTERGPMASVPIEQVGCPVCGSTLSGEDFCSQECATGFLYTDEVADTLERAGLY